VEWWPCPFAGGEVEVLSYDVISSFEFPENNQLKTIRPEYAVSGLRKPTITFPYCKQMVEEAKCINESIEERINEFS
jgi:hypothetical protein